MHSSQMHHFLLQDFLVEPVIAADGHTYEKGALQDWLAHCNVSPVTGQPLMSTAVMPNLVISGIVANKQLS